ncbi:MAG: exodeoxyribonuclease VII large subunit [Alphaproteobacteria bacterium]
MPQTNVPEYSVQDIARAIKQTMEGAFSRVRVRGEISGLKRPGSGHIYFDLKDDAAVLAGVSWRGMVPKLGLMPEEGMEVIAIGRITTYAPRSSYQMVVERMELAGEGALLKLLEARKKQLAAEGLFAPERKQPIPGLPARIGVITSPTGAVIRDILHRLGERFPRDVILWPVRVQGETAAQEVAHAIAGMNALPVDQRPDLIIVARGGGSLEDLMPFNEEVVVRAAAASQLPLISAVGHETDTTLIDHAADLRAPTPTAAAELAVPVRRELVARLEDQMARMAGSWSRRVEDGRKHGDSLMRQIGDPRRLLETASQKLDDRAERLDRGALHSITIRRQSGDALAARLPNPEQQVRLARQRLGTVADALDRGIRDRLAHHKEALNRQEQSLSLRPIRDRLRQNRRDADRLADAMMPAMTRLFSARRDRLSGLFRLLESTSHKSILKRGFVLVRDSGGTPVTSAQMARSHADLVLEFDAGEQVQVNVSSSDAPPAPSRPKPRPKSKPRNPSSGDDGQGELL